MIWNTFEIMLWGVAIAILFVCAFQWFNTSRKREDIDEKLVLLAFAFYIFCFGLYWIFWISASFFIPGIYKNNTFYGDFNSVSSTFLSKLGNTTIDIGFIVFVLTFEKILKRTKYILTALITSVVIIQVISSHEIYYLIQNLIIGPIFYFFTIGIFLYYAKWSRYELKVISSILVNGFLIMAIGVSLYHNPYTRATNAIPLILAPIVVIIGALITTSPTLIDPKLFFKVRNYWLLLGILVVILCWSILIFMISAGVPATSVPFLNYLIFIIIVMFMFYYSMKILKSEPLIEGKGEFPNILSMFERPQKMTEEEVSVSKEKKICIVCKGKVARNNIYLCPECDTFYCNKCSNTLVDLENMCWVCDTPFDESKPVKPYKKEEEDVGVEEKIQNNSKKTL